MKLNDVINEFELVPYSQTGYFEYKGASLDLSRTIASNEIKEGDVLTFTPINTKYFKGH